MADQDFPDVTLPPSVEKVLERGYPIHMVGSNMSRYMMRAPDLREDVSIDLAGRFFDFVAGFGVYPSVTAGGYVLRAVSGAEGEFPLAFGEYFVVDADGSSTMYGKMPERGVRTFLAEHEKHRTSDPVMGEIDHASLHPKTKLN